MDSHEFRRFRLLFEAFGFEPFMQSKLLGDYWTKLQMFLVFVQVTVICIYRDYIVYDQDVVGLSWNFAMLFSTFCSYFIAIYVSRKNYTIPYHQENLRVLMEKLYVNPDRVHENLHQSYKLKFSILITLQTVALIEEVIFFSDESQTTRFIYACSIPIFFCYMKHLHAIFYIDLINCYLSVLLDQMQDLTELIICNETKLMSWKYNKFLFQRMKLCKSFYTILYDMNQWQNESAGKFFLVTQVTFYVHILSNLYWTTFRFFNTEFYLLICELTQLSFDEKLWKHSF